jgi:antitoxin component YwqK of YwqJK toxin-antitoxin module
MKDIISAYDHSYEKENDPPYLWKSNINYDLIYKKSNDSEDSPTLFIREGKKIDDSIPVDLQSVGFGSQDGLSGMNLGNSEIEEDSIYTYYPNGRIEYVGTMVNHKREGNGQWFYSSGKIR